MTVSKLTPKAPRERARRDWVEWATVAVVLAGSVCGLISLAWHVVELVIDAHKAGWI